MTEESEKLIAQLTKDLVELGTKMQQRINQLTTERDALAAQVEQLLIKFNDLTSCHINSDFNEALSKLRIAFNQTPAQCLAEIKAQAREDLISSCAEHFPTFFKDRPFHTPIRDMKRCADILKAKDGE
jgi:outer membrane murein-binding lipoprotein Lpp